MFRLNLVFDPRLSAGGRYLAYIRARLDREADLMTEEIVVADLETGAEWHPGRTGGWLSPAPPGAAGRSGSGNPVIRRPGAWRAVTATASSWTWTGHRTEAR